MTIETDEQPKNEPSWRKPVGMILILLLILLWSGVAVTLIDHLSGLGFWLQLPVYVILGIAWIFPMRPMLRWMNTGSFRQFVAKTKNGASDGT